MRQAHVGTTTISLDLSDLADGMYFVKVNDGKAVKVIKKYNAKLPRLISLNNKEIVLHKIPRSFSRRGIYTFLLITISTFITYFYFSRLKKTNLVTGPILHLKLPHKFVCVWFIA